MSKRQNVNKTHPYNRLKIERFVENLNHTGF